MVTKEEAINAQEIIDEYNEYVNKKLVTCKPCICCKSKIIEPLVGMALADGMIKSSEQEQGCWNDGSVNLITFGYGSSNDGRSFYVAICDNCIQQLEKDGLATDFRKLRKEEAKYDL